MMCRLRGHPTGTCRFDSFSSHCTCIGGVDAEVVLTLDSRKLGSLVLSTEMKVLTITPGIASSLRGVVSLKWLKQTAVEKTSDEPAIPAQHAGGRHSYHLVH